MSIVGRHVGLVNIYHENIYPLGFTKQQEARSETEGKTLTGRMISRWLHAQ